MFQVEDLVRVCRQTQEKKNVGEILIYVEKDRESSWKLMEQTHKVMDKRRKNTPRNGTLDAVVQRHISTERGEGVVTQT